MARPLGSQGKNKAFLMDRLKAIYGEDFHPIMRMAENAVTLHDQARGTMDTADLKLSIDAWDRIAQYTEPKLKASEVNLNAMVQATEVDISGVQDMPAEDDYE